LALGLTPDLGPRMAGKLLRDLGSPEAIFNASLTALYVRGNVELLNRHSISVVGSRRPSPYGNQMAHGRLGLSQLRSGNRERIGPAVSTRAPIKARSVPKRSASIGVLSCGIDGVYPKENKNIFEEMSQRCAIITEFPTGRFPAAQNFPIRNRIFAAWL
jgi:DNA processing protein